MKIVILQSLGINDEGFEEAAGPLKDKGHELVAYDDGKSDAETLKARVSDADALVVANMPLSGEVIKAAQKLKFISVAFTGYDHVDLDACRQKGIQVSNVAGYSTNSVAELTFGGSMSFRVEGNTLLTARPAEAGFVADA